MATEALIIDTGAGRFVQGDLFKGSDKNITGGPRKDRAGNPTVQFFLGFAIPKTDPTWPAISQAIAQKAALDFPGGDSANGQPFAWKIIDGDQSPEKEGFAGHWVLRLTSGFATKVYDQSVPPQQIVDPNAVKRGDYLRLRISVRGNGQQPVAQGGKPGIFLNPVLIQLVGYGPEIVGGPDAAEVFAQPVALPPGASATPVASAAPMPATPGVAPVAVAPAAAPPVAVATAPVTAPPVATVAPVTVAPVAVAAPAAAPIAVVPAVVAPVAAAPVAAPVAVTPVATAPVVTPAAGFIQPV